MDEKQLKQLYSRYKIELFFGLFSFIAGLILAIVFPVMSIIDPKPFDAGSLRALIVIPFAIWYGVRCLKKAECIKLEVLNAIAK
jgi:hypothetical protein